MRLPWVALCGIALVAATALAVVSSQPDPAEPVPDDSRLVGRGRFVVAVPHEWSTGEVRCGQPIGNTVAFWSDVVPTCFIRTTEPFNSVEIRPLRAGRPTLKPLKHQATVTSKVDDVRIVVNSNDSTLVRQIVRSAQRLPKGRTTVPALVSGDGCGPWPRRQPQGFEAVFYEECLERAGLVPDVTRHSPGRFPPSQNVLPREGTPVTLGSRVELQLPEPEIG